MKTKIIYPILFLLISSFSFSQGFKEKKGKVKALKIAYITEELDLTTEEAQKFWPIYNAFDDKQSELRHEKMAKEYVAKLLQQIKEADTDEKRYKLFKSKCWSKYRWEIAIEYYDDVLMNEVSDGYRRFRDMLSKRKKITQQKRYP